MLRQLIVVLENTPADHVLSVQQLKNLRAIFNNIILIGVSSNLLKNLATYRELKGYDAIGDESVLIRYNRLTVTIFCLTECVNCIKLRYALLPQCLKAILCGYYQIIYCPLKKPTAAVKSSNFVMTESIYKNLIEERNIFNVQFNKLSTTIHKTIYVRETMLIINESAPIWFKKSVSCNLNRILLNENGLENISWAMFDNTYDYDRDDRSKTWKIIDVILRLLFSLYGTPVFIDNICPQVRNLLKVKGHDDGKPVAPFERIFVLTAKRTYEMDESLCTSEFLPIICGEYFRNFHQLEHDREINVTETITQGVRLIYLCFVDDDDRHIVIDGNNSLPIALLDDLIPTLYNLYAAIVLNKQKSLITLKVELKAILLKCFKEFKNRDELYDFLLFGHECGAIKKRINVEILISDDAVSLKRTPHPTRIPATSSTYVINTIICDNDDLRFALFFYCLNEPKKYTSNTDKTLLELEDDFCIDETLDRNMAVYKLLSELSEDKNIQKRIGDEPKELIEYIENVLDKEIEQFTRDKRNETDPDEQAFFTILMILDALTANSDESTLSAYERLIPSLNRLTNVKNIEYKSLIVRIMDNVKTRRGCTRKTYESVEITKVDKALEDVCDPLLPVRGHGLMTLTKLINSKDEEAMNRKQYILNIFQVRNVYLLY